jgi:NAD(P)-dependent dehydrogenase (short-subunit alcohol dehydrogenase family)/acyl carrier protein
VEAARLVRMPLGPSQPLPLQANATYLVTGGTGSLGRRIADYLQAQGAGRVVTCGRSGGDRKCDVSDVAQVRALIDDLPQLRGVVHAAGIRRDGLSLDEQSMEDVISAKVRGACNLHEATINRPLDFFILVSSAAGTLGSPGQAAYGAANAAMDDLASERKRLGLPALSVAWGPWKDSAMVVKLSEKQQESWTNRGIRPLNPDDALDDLGAIVASGESHVLYLDADWDSLSRMWGEHQPEFLEGLVAKQAPLHPEALTAWAELPPREARSQITEILRNEVVAVLALDKPFASRTPFFDLGMDSLTALELRNRLQMRFGTPIPATLLFDCPSLDPLIAWMLKRVTAGPAESQEPSESDLERMLAAKLDELQARGLR